MSAGFTFEATLVLTPQQISDTLVAAFEGGSNYWYARLDSLDFDLADKDLRRATVAELGLSPGTANFWHAFLPLTEAGVRIGDREEPDEHWPLNRATIKRGIGLMAKSPHGRRRLMEMMNETGDADTGDTFLQFCVLGEVVFG